MRFLLAEVGIESQGKDFVQMHEEFNRCLIQEARAGRRFIVVIDEAQNLDPSVLETVRLLSDFELLRPSCYRSFFRASRSWRPSCHIRD